MDTEKTFEKIQYSVMIRTFNKVSIKGAYINIIKAMYGKPTVSIHAWQWKTESFSFKIRNKKRMPTLSTFIQRSIGRYRAVKQEKEIKGIHIGKGEVKLSLFADDMISYVENPEDSTKNR